MKRTHRRGDRLVMYGVFFFFNGSQTFMYGVLSHYVAHLKLSVVSQLKLTF